MTAVLEHVAVGRGDDESAWPTAGARTVGEVAGRLPATRQRGGGAGRARTHGGSACRHGGHRVTLGAFPSTVPAATCPTSPAITRPPLPDRIGRLAELASDIWWVWNPAARSVFRQLDYGLWRSSAHNPVRMLRLVPAERLEQAAARSRFPGPLRRGDRGPRSRPQRRGHLVGAAQRHRRRRAASPTSPPSSRCTSRCRSTPAASACWPAITARKPATSACRSSASASCIRRATSTRASRPKAGRRSATSGSTGPTRRSSRRSRPTASRASSPCRSATAPCWWRCGASGSAACKLYLLDTDLEENAPWDRELSARLYGGDRETRIQQEIILGIGGVRALRALGIDPAVWHLNEGHAAFVVLQRIRELHRAGRVVRRRARAKCAGRRSSRRTRRCRPATTRSRSTWSRRTSPAAGARSASTASDFLALGALRQRQRPAVQHDGAGAAHRPARQRRQPAARRGHARDVGADLAGTPDDDAAGRAPSPTASTCRRGCRPTMARAVRRLPRRRLARPARRSGAVGRGCSTSRTRSCGRRAGAAQLPVHVHPRARPRSAGRDERVSAAPRRRRPARCSIPTR